MASGSFNISRTSGSTYLTFKVNWSSTANRDGNYSTLSVAVYVMKSSASTSATYGTANTTVNVGGTAKSENGLSFTVNPSGTTLLFSKAGYKVNHNNNGTKTVNISVSVGGNVMGASGSANVTLDNIPRQAIMNSATNFTDEGDPSFTYTNTANASMSCWLEPNPNGEHLAVRTLSGTSGTYTWVLTEEERNQLRSKCTTSNSCTCRVGLYSTIGGSTYASYKDITMSIVNAKPTFDVAYLDTNSSTTAITNNNQQIIQNNSTLQINISNATALKYATLKNASVNVNGVTTTETLSSSSLTFNIGTLDVSNDLTIPVTITDSRNNSTTINLTLEVLSWSLPSAIITLGRLNNYYSTTNLTVDADYSSLDNKNTITIQYQTKKVSDADYGALTTIQDNVQTQFTVDNLYEWNVKVILTDRLGSTSYISTLQKGIPIIYFDNLLNSVAVNCFPVNNESLEVKGIDILEAIQGTVLYSDTTGTNGNVTLSDDVSNYSYLEIFYKKDSASSVKVQKSDWQRVSLSLDYFYSPNVYQIALKTITISDTTITVVTSQCYYVNFINNYNVNVGIENSIKITKVIGYKY